ncbi:MAG TPA: tRNA (N(6)-L-threonylcarbamoyladenosine(37)-C(2))-methylthiotransferase MtaB [Candidatus Eisenbacteria bacterium]|nr:tRNA (N(6)-L-threonylcarbamoyladenosine(37)-C(2))-methylthiotransferase MtaB [Candidatus Eisenbacteria bacterium]
MPNEVPTPEGCRSAPRVSFFTLGCRLNQHDTAAMRSDLERAGWRADDSGEGSPDVVIVNSCTVTRRADQESRQLIRKLARERPGARIVVTGCYAQRAPEEVRGLPGVALVLGTAERESIASIDALRAVAAGREGAAVEVAPGRARRAVTEASPLHFGRARALLKIQDGCDTFCGYCIVPYVRGRSRSLPREAVLEQARRLLAAGFRELVLTGADLGDYRDGHKRTGERGDLASLVEALLSLPAQGTPHRIRLSSIEPNKVDDSLLDLLATEPRLCRHLHLPLQSGSATMLRAMRRAYEPSDYARLVERAAASGPIAIGADVIVGFPGEGPREFAETLDFLRAIPVSFLHVFRYSERPGTRAATLDARPPAAVARERAALLRRLGDAKREAFARSLVGSVRGVVMEARRGKEGAWLGTSDLYTTVAMTRRPAHPGPFQVRIEGRDGDVLRGTPVGEPPARPEEAVSER